VAQHTAQPLQFGIHHLPVSQQLDQHLVTPAASYLVPGFWFRGQALS